MINLTFTFPEGTLEAFRRSGEILTDVPPATEEDFQQWVGGCICAALEHIMRDPKVAEDFRRLNKKELQA